MTQFRDLIMRGIIFFISLFYSLLTGIVSAEEVRKDILTFIQSELDDWKDERVDETREASITTLYEIQAYIYELPIVQGITK